MCFGSHGDKMVRVLYFIYKRPIPFRSIGFSSQSDIWSSVNRPWVSPLVVLPKLKKSREVRAFTSINGLLTSEKPTRRYGYGYEYATPSPRPKNSHTS